MNISDDELKKKLTPEQYRIMREGGTEAPFSGKYHDAHEPGLYRCAACGAELFSSDAKFDSGTGWPSFIDSVHPVRNGASNGVNRESVVLREDRSHGMSRVEVLCKKCGSHLGHVFDDLPETYRSGRAGGPAEKGGKRYCINSACLELDQNKSGK